MLYTRWVASQEGQKLMAQSGRTPAHPKVEPLDRTRTEKIYAISVADIKEDLKRDLQAPLVCFEGLT